jgi:hypothetical protein
VMRGLPKKMVTAEPMVAYPINTCHAPSRVEGFGLTFVVWGLKSWRGQRKRRERREVDAVARYCKCRMLSQHRRVARFFFMLYRCCYDCAEG